MPKILKTFLCLSALDLTVLCAAGIGSMLHQDAQAKASEQTPSAIRQQPADRLFVLSVADAVQEEAKFEACARGVRDDYSDDPQTAFWWIKTVCH
jgi:ABC-type sugar transport system substrate-binding protein